MDNRLAKRLRLYALGSLGLVFFSVAYAQNVGPDSPPAVNEKGKDAWSKFLSAEHERAFAVSPKGDWGFAHKRESRVKAVQVALYSCNKASKNICRIYAVNDDIVYKRYAAFEQGSRALLEKLKEEKFNFSEYGEELRDYGVAPTEGLRASPYHAKTPLSNKGVRTIKTVDLVKAMSSATPPVLIDVLEGDGHQTIPGAYWVRGGGMSGGEDMNADIRDRLGYVLTGLTGKDKSVPLVFLCLDSMCWLSYNAAIRARELGYSDVSWYRGGTKAWENARLDTIEAAQYGQVW